MNDSRVKFFLNEEGKAYAYDPATQALAFPNDDHTAYDTRAEAEAAARRTGRFDEDHLSTVAELTDSSGDTTVVLVDQIGSSHTSALAPLIHLKVADQSLASELPDHLDSDQAYARGVYTPEGATQLVIALQEAIGRALMIQGGSEPFTVIAETTVEVTQ